MAKGRHQQSVVAVVAAALVSHPFRAVGASGIQRRVRAPRPGLEAVRIAHRIPNHAPACHDALERADQRRVLLVREIGDSRSVHPAALSKRRMLAPESVVVDEKAINVRRAHPVLAKEDRVIPEPRCCRLGEVPEVLVER